MESLLTAELPRSVAVAAVGECINYLFDAGNTSVEPREVISADSRITRTGRAVSAGRRRTGARARNRHRADVISRETTGLCS